MSKIHCANCKKALTKGQVNKLLAGTAKCPNCGTRQRPIFTEARETFTRSTQELQARTNAALSILWAKVDTLSATYPEGSDHNAVVSPIYTTMKDVEYALEEGKVEHAQKLLGKAQVQYARATSSKGGR